jgi:DNA-binding transcriptional LysR family regulator
MELRHIRYFLAVAEERNFTRAAARVGIGQPPLSQQIRDLEAEVGAPLFHRIPQGAELTAAGAAFLETVRLIPPQVERAIGAARRAARGETGSLRVGFTGSAPFNPIVTAAIRAFKRRYPDVALSLEEDNTAHLIAALRDNLLDIVFLRSESLEGDGAAPGPNAGPHASTPLDLRPLADEPMLAVLPASHPAARAERVDLMALRHDPLILTPRGVGQTLYDVVIETCRQAGFEPILGQLAPQLASVVNLVSAEFGFSLVPASMRQVQVTGVAYRDIANAAPTARLSLAHRRGDTSVTLRHFITHTMASIG